MKCAPYDPATPGLKNLCAARSGSAYVDDVARYAGILNNVEDDPAHQILVATIAGVGQVSVAAGPVLSPACTFGASESAGPAIRMQALAKLMPEHASASICSDDETSAVAALAAATRSLVGDPCVPVMLAHRIYAFIFARPSLQKFNTFLYKTSLRGLGVLNGNDRTSGEIWFLQRVLDLPDKAVVFDVGANIGLYSATLLKYFPNAAVFAFEPHPINFSKLRLICNINPVSAAVGASQRKTVIFDHEKMDGTAHASLFRGVIENIHCSKSVSHTVPCITLDRFAKEKKSKRSSF